MLTLRIKLTSHYRNCLASGWVARSCLTCGLTCGLTSSLTSRDRCQTTANYTPISPLMKSTKCNNTILTFLWNALTNLWWTNQANAWENDTNTDFNSDSINPLSLWLDLRHGIRVDQHLQKPFNSFHAYSAWHWRILNLWRVWHPYPSRPLYACWLCLLIIHCLPIIQN